MEHRAETSSYALLHDTRRGSWVLAFTAADWERLFPPPELRECTTRGFRTYPRRRPQLLAPVVVLVLTIASAALLHALR